MIEDLIQPSESQPQLTCKEHKQALILKGCLDKACRSKVLMCQQCLTEDAHLPHSHNEQLKQKGIKQFIFELSQQLQSQTRENKQQLDHFLRNDDNMQVYKYIQDNKHHLQKVKENLDSQKMIIAKDITNIVELIQLKLQDIKQNMFSKIDDLYKQYESIFEQTKKAFLIKFFPASNYYFSNSIALSCKLAQLGSSAEDYLKRLRSPLEQSTTQLQDLFQQLFRLNAQSFYDSDLQKLSESIQEPLNQYFNLQLSSNNAQLPPTFERKYSNPSTNYVGNRNERSERSERNDSAQKLKQPTYALSETFSINKSGTNARYNKQIDLTRQQWINIKHTRRFNFDFPISSIIGISKSFYVTVGQNENKIRTFDSERKQLQLIEAHNNPINCLELLNTQLFITGSEDGTIIVWQATNNSVKIINQYSFTTKPIMSVLSMQNNSFVFVDCEGKIGYKNLISQLELSLFIGKGRNRKYKLGIVKPGELFCIYVSGDNGGQIIQISEREKQLRRISANSLPVAPTLLPFTVNDIILASNCGLKIVNINKDDYIGGHEVETLSFEYSINRVTYIICIPYSEGNCTQYRIINQGASKYDIAQKEFQIEQFEGLKARQLIQINNQIRTRPQLQLIKNLEKVQLLIADPGRKCLDIYDIILK